MTKKVPVGVDKQREARNKKAAETQASRAILRATALLAFEAVHVQVEPSPAPIRSSSGGAMHLLPLSSE